MDAPELVFPKYYFRISDNIIKIIDFCQFWVTGKGDYVRT